MSLPSIRTLSAIFGDNAKKAREILELSDTKGKLSEYKSVSQARAQFPHGIQKYYVKMLALNDLGEFHGIEAAETQEGDEWAEYLNAGDTYTPTLIYWRGAYRVQSLGDFIEKSKVKFK